MQVGRDRKCVPSNRMAVCSRILKRELLRWLPRRALRPGRADVVYIGYDWSEPHRITSAQRFWAPWTMEALLADPPVCGAAAGPVPLARHRAARLYKYGLSHANCGGVCVRGGRLNGRSCCKVDRCGYLEWEAEEQETRDLLGKDVMHPAGPHGRYHNPSVAAVVPRAHRAAAVHVRCR